MPEPYRDPALSIDDRVEDLLGRMTLDEKLAQVAGIWLAELVEGGRFDADQVAAKLEHGIGHVTRIGASTGLRPAASARLMNQIQQVAVERTRLGIPIVVHEEAVAGYCARDATQFPQAIGLASTWDEDLVFEVGCAIRRQMTAVGARHALSPVLDIARDPRFGRVEETYGESPYLAGRLGTAYVRGLQGDDLRTGVIATGKHFLGYGLPEGGMNHAPVQLGPREVREVYAEPFAAAIRDGGLASIMNSYSSVDGLPCGGSPTILGDLLRDELGFDGVVVSDYGTIGLLVTHHRVAADAGEAGARALVAGIDLELPSRLGYGAPLRSRIEDGSVPGAVLDRAVARVLQSKFRLGLFESPYVDERAAAAVFDTPDDRRLAACAAAASIVLLENGRGLLPIDASAVRRLAVIGPAADDPRLLQGDYHYPAHVELAASGAGFTGPSRAAGSAGDDGAADDGSTFAPGPYMVAHVTPLAAIRAGTPGPEVIHERGCDVTGDDASGLGAAAAAAASADLAVVFVGGRSGLTEQSTVGESRDASDLALTGVQERLVEEVAATGTPTVVVLVSGRVHAVAGIARQVSAIVQAWLPGEEGGTAIADVLFGRAEPGGRLPVSMPRTVGQVPVHHDHRAGGGRSMWRGDYVDGPSGPLFPFGHGLSYTTFAYGQLQVVASGTTEAAVVLQVDLTNTGSRPGTEVVQLYVRDEVASVARPYRQLVGFAKLALDAGESVAVTFDVHPSRLAFYDEVMRFVTEPGSFAFSVGGSSATASSRITVDLPGGIAEYRQREIVATRVRVSSPAP